MAPRATRSCSRARPSIVALLALNITGIPFLGLMGTVGALAVAVAVLIAITFTPALLSLVGMRMLRKKERADDRPPACDSRADQADGDVAGDRDARRRRGGARRHRSCPQCTSGSACRWALRKPSISSAVQGVPGDGRLVRAGPEQSVARRRGPAEGDDGHTASPAGGRRSARRSARSPTSPRSLPIGQSTDRTVIAFQVLPTTRPVVRSDRDPRPRPARPLPRHD